MNETVHCCTYLFGFVLLCTDMKKKAHDDIKIFLDILVFIASCDIYSCFFTIRLHDAVEFLPHIVELVNVYSVVGHPVVDEIRLADSTTADICQAFIQVNTEKIVDGLSYAISARFCQVVVVSRILGLRERNDNGHFIALLRLRHVAFRRLLEEMSDNGIDIRLSGEYAWVPESLQAPLTFIGW